MKSSNFILGIIFTAVTPFSLASAEALTPQQKKLIECQTSNSDVSVLNLDDIVKSTQPESTLEERALDLIKCMNIADGNTPNDANEHTTTYGPDKNGVTYKKQPNGDISIIRPR